MLSALMLRVPETKYSSVQCAPVFFQTSRSKLTSQHSRRASIQHLGKSFLQQYRRKNTRRGTLADIVTCTDFMQTAVLHAIMTLDYRPVLYFDVCAVAQADQTRTHQLVGRPKATTRGTARNVVESAGTNAWACGATTPTPVPIANTMAVKPAKAFPIARYSRLCDVPKR